MRISNTEELELWIAVNISSYKESELWRTSNSATKSWSFHSTYVEGKNNLLLMYGDFHTYLAMNICIGIGLQFTKSQNLKNIVAKSWSFHSTYVESKNTIHFNFDVWRFPYIFSNEYVFFVCLFVFFQEMLVRYISIGLHTNPTLKHILVMWD